MPGVICSVATCKSNSIKAKQDGQQIRFFYFPKDPLIRKEWVRKCQQKNKFDPECKRICSLHFKVDDYEDGIKAQLMHYVPRFLKKEAVPSINLTSSIDPAPESSSSLDASEGCKENSEQLRKQIVAECLQQHQEREKADEVSNSESATSSFQPVSSRRRRRNSDKLGKRIFEECLQRYKDKAIEKKVKNSRKKVTLPSREIPAKKVATSQLKKEIVTSQLKKGDVAKRVNKEVLTKPNDECACCVSKDYQLQALQEENECLKFKIKVHKRTETDLKDKIQLMQKQLKDSDAKFENRVKDAFKHFLSDNQVDIVLKKKAKVWWTEEEFTKAFNILQMSRRFYRYLKNTLYYPLPGISTIQEWTRDIYSGIKNAGSTEYILPDQPIDSVSLSSEQPMDSGNLPSDPPMDSENLPSDQPMNSVNLSSDPPMDCVNLPSDQSMQSENVPSDQAIESEVILIEMNNSNEILNLREAKIKTFCSAVYVPPNNDTVSERDDSKNSLNKSKGISTERSKRFHLQLQRKHYITKLILDKYRKNRPKPVREAPFVCSICQMGFYQKNTLKRHFKMHTVENPWTCDVCNEVFSSRFYLEKHILIHMDNDRFLCDICNKSFVKKITFKDHYLKHKNLQPLDVFNKDQGAVECADESTSDQDFSMQTKIKPYVCHICKELFEDKNGLKTHLALHEKEKKVEKTVLDEKKTVLEGKEVYSCEFCFKDFKNKFYYRHHVRSHTETVIYECELCDKKFRNRQCYKRHRLVHENSRMFTCQFCDKTFASQGSLQRHIAVLHENNENKMLFLCNHCSKGFSQKRYLSQHLLTHSEEKPYGCEFCLKRFSQKSTLKKHIDTHKI